MDSLKTEIFSRIREEYKNKDSRKNSFLYRYILNNELSGSLLKETGMSKEDIDSMPVKEKNQKAKKILASMTAEEKDQKIQELANRRLYDIGFPLLSKESKRTGKNTALDIMDEYVREFGLKDIMSSDDFDYEPYEILYNELNERKNCRALIPVRIDAATGIGLYIIGKDHYTYFPEVYSSCGKTCGLGFVAEWYSDCDVKDPRDRDDLHISLIADYDPPEFKDAGPQYRLLTNDPGEEYYRFRFYREVNGTMPQGIMPMFHKYFQLDDVTDFALTEEEKAEARKACPL
jgi:hypothetical protein